MSGSRRRSGWIRRRCAGWREASRGHAGDDGEQDRADEGEEREQAAPIEERVELPAEQWTDDGGEATEDRQPRIEADQLRTGEHVSPGRLSDHDADAAGQALDEPGGDECLDARAGRT